MTDRDFHFKAKKKRIQQDTSWRKRYRDLHEQDFKTRYPGAYKDGHYTEPKYPDVTKANGLQNAIENIINWSGFRATRINNIARLPDKQVKTASGMIFSEKRFSRATRKGQADISSTINGKSYMWEVKIGNDRPSEHQIKEQEKERKAGGGYEFVKSIYEFLALFDNILVKFHEK